MTTRHIVVEVNPRDGTQRGLATRDRVQPIFAAAGIELEIRVTQSPGHAREMARMLKLSGVDSICPIGGDGTIYEVAGG